MSLARFFIATLAGTGTTGPTGPTAPPDPSVPAGDTAPQTIQLNSAPQVASVSEWYFDNNPGFGYLLGSGLFCYPHANAVLTLKPQRCRYIDVFFPQNTAGLEAPFLEVKKWDGTPVALQQIYMGASNSPSGAPDGNTPLVTIDTGIESVYLITITSDGGPSYGILDTLKTR